MNTLATMMPILKDEFDNVFQLIENKIGVGEFSHSYYAYVDGEMIQFKDNEGFACVCILYLNLDQGCDVLSLYLDNCQPKALLTSES